MSTAAAKKFFFDVFLSHGKTVYKEVPFEVVTDWLQQGRLLPEDRIRPNGTEAWFEISQVPAFASFVPKDDPLRTDEKAEALEPMETGFGVKHEEEEEADPDMIPLIDVSLVLLIFFMITSTVAAVTSAIRVPEAKNIAQLTENPKFLWVGIEYIDETSPARYMVRMEGTKGSKESFRDLNEEQALTKIDEILTAATEQVPELRVAAHRQLNFDLIKNMALELEKYKTKEKVKVIHIEVGEKK